MNPEENMFAAALEAMDCHDRPRARDLLTRLLKINPKNAEYWLYMSAVVETRKETIYCLNESIRLDPGNISAKRGLILHGELPVDGKLVLPLSAQRRNWEKEMPHTSLKDQVLAAPPLYRTLGILGSLVLVVALVGVFVLISRGLKSKQSISPFGTAPAVDLSTQAPALSAHFATSTLVGPTPLAALLKATFTPTPFYGLTPHPRYESFLAGMRAYNINDMDGAIRNFQQVATLEPGSGDLPFLIGEAYRQKGDFSNALASYRLALALSPEFAPAYLGRGMATMGLAPENYKDAKADLKTAIDLDPKLLEAYLDLASIVMERQSDGATALTYLETAMALAPDSAVVYFLRARADLLLQKPENAVQDARHAIDLDFTQLAAYRLLGEALILAGDKSGALGPLYTYTLFETQDSEALTWLGVAYLENKQPDKALIAFNMGLLADPHNFDALLARGKLNLANGEIQAAVADLEAAMQINSRTFEGNLALGQAYFQSGKFGDAYMKFSTAEGFEDSSNQQAEMLYWRARSLQALGETSAAVRDWQTLLDLNTQYGDPAWRTYASLQLHNLGAGTPTITAGITRSVSPLPTGRLATITRVSPSSTQLIVPKNGFIPLEPYNPLAGITPVPTGTPAPPMTLTPVKTPVAGS